MSLIELPLLLHCYLVYNVTQWICLCSRWSLAILCQLIASSRLHRSVFYISLILYFRWDKLCLLLLNLYLSCFQLYSLLQTTLLLLTFASVILFLLLELGGKVVYMKKFLVPFECVRTDVFLVCYGLAETKRHTVPDDVDKVIVNDLDTDIKSIDIIKVFVDSTCFLEILAIVKHCV